VARLLGKRVLVTNADRYGGPPIVELFGKEGAEVIADTTDYTERGAAQRVAEAAGDIDVLVANFAGPLRIMPFTKMLGAAWEFQDEDFQAYLDELVWPMVNFVRAVAPRMVERRSGKIVGVTSCASLRAIPGLAVYSAARGAQNTFVMTTGAELAPHNVQFNAIGSGFFVNNTYFTPEMLADPEIHAQLTGSLPTGKMGEGKDLAELALTLAGDASNFMAGQVIAYCGGWTT